MASKRKPGKPMSHAERAERTGRVLVQIYLDRDIAAKLDDEIVPETDPPTRTAAITRLIARARARR